MKKFLITLFKAFKYPSIYIFYGIIVAFLVNILVNFNNAKTGSTFDPNAFSKFIVFVNSIAIILAYRHIMKKLKIKNEHSFFLQKLSVRPTHYIVYGSALGIVLALAISVILGILYNEKFFPNVFEQYRSSISNIFENNFTIIQLLCIIFLIPSFEEFIFRGLMMEELKQNFKIKYAILIQSLIFSLTHGEPIQMVYGFILGLAFTALVVISESLWSSIFAHIFFNTTNVLFYFIDRRFSYKFLPALSSKLGIPIIIICTILIIIIASSLLKHKKLVSESQI